MSEPNKEIKDLIRKNDIRMNMIADGLGISESTFYRWLRRDLPHAKKVAIKKVIKEIKIERINTLQESI